MQGMQGCLAPPGMHTYIVGSRGRCLKRRWRSDAANALPGCPRTAAMGRCGMGRCGMGRCGAVWHGAVWHGAISCVSPERTVDRCHGLRADGGQVSFSAMSPCPLQARRHLQFDSFWRYLFMYLSFCTLSSARCHSTTSWSGVDLGTPAGGTCTAGGPCHAMWCLRGRSPPMV